MANSKSTQSSKTGMSEDTKSIITVLLLIFFFPVGLILMWFWTKWPVWVKLLISFPIVLILIAIVATAALVAINPRAQIKRAECVKVCENIVTKNACIERCLQTSP